MIIGNRQTHWFSFLGLLAWSLVPAWFAAVAAILRRVPRDGWTSLQSLKDPHSALIFQVFAISMILLVAAPNQKARPVFAWALGAVGVAGLGYTMILSSFDGMSDDPFRGWSTLLLFWVSAWLFVDCLSNTRFEDTSAEFLRRRLIPIFFGASLIALWEALAKGLDIPPVILPAPSQIWAALITNIPILWADFVQTVIRSVIPGYAMGCGAAILTAVAIDRSPFLQRGLLPIGNLAAALPIVGIAPIMVMWFGFDWHSKAAVVVVMCFFPMLVNTMAGLQASDAMQRDLMRTYAAGYWQTLVKLRLPAAAPFIFNGLKICTTLALIGAIVAEFFGTPIVGMGFRISTEIGRMALDMVWAEIVVAALAGSAFYGLVALMERAATFWHPSQRS